MLDRVARMSLGRARAVPVCPEFEECRHCDRRCNCEGADQDLDDFASTPIIADPEREDGKRVGNGVRPLGWRDDQYPSPARAAKRQGFFALGSAIADVVAPIAAQY